STRPSMVRRTLCDGARETACCAAAPNGKADVQAMKRRPEARWEFTIVLNEQILVTEKSGTAREERQWRRSGRALVLVFLLRNRRSRGLKARHVIAWGGARSAQPQDLRDGFSEAL